MFSVEDRDRVHDRVLEMAAADPHVVAAAVCKSADNGARDDAWICRGQLQHAVTHAVTVVDAEHEGILRFLVRVRDYGGDRCK